MKENHTEIAKRIFRTRYLKRQSDGTFCKSIVETSACLQQPSRDTSGFTVVRYQIESKSDPKQTPVEISHAKPRTPQPTLASVPVRHQHSDRESPADQSFSCSPSLQRKEKPLDMLGCKVLDLSYHSNISAAQILQEVPKMPGSKHVQLNLDIDKQSEDASSKTHCQRPTGLPISMSSTADSIVSHSSEVVSARVSNRVQGILSPTKTETNIRGRGTKRLAHMSDREIEAHRQDIKHKILASASSPPPLKRPRVSSTSSNRKGLRAELIKKMSKK